MPCSVTFHVFIFAIAFFGLSPKCACLPPSVASLHYFPVFPLIFTPLSASPSPSLPRSFLLSGSLSLSAEAHQGKQMLWLLFMFPLGLAFIQIIHRPCTVQKLGLNGIHWQLSLLYPRSHTLRPYHRCCMGRGSTETAIAEGIRTGAAPFALHAEVHNWGRHHCADLGRGETSETEKKIIFFASEVFFSGIFWILKGSFSLNLNWFQRGSDTRSEKLL